MTAASTATAGPPTGETYDCRKDFAAELAELARADERIVAVCNDSEKRASG